MIDIESLRVIWWLLLGILLMGFAITDGFDIGAAILLPLVTKNEKERGLVLNTIKPFWEGNQVWIILSAGAIFAAWPYVYAVAFSGFYLLILLLLLTIGISRPVSFKYRDRLHSFLWRRFWDWLVFLGGFIPAIIFGLLMGNLLTGTPFYFDEMLQIHYSGSFSQLFHPFAWWCGLTSLAMLVMHGGLYLAMKTKNPIRSRAIFCSRFAACLMLICFAIGGLWIATSIVGYTVVDGVDPYGLSNPLHKEVAAKLGGWLDNYFIYPWTMIVPFTGFIGTILAILTASSGHSRVAFICSSLSIMGVIGTVGVSMFPFILPSSTNLSSSLLVWDASSSELTLLLMLVAVIVFLPVVIFYTSWVYYVLSRNRAISAGDEKHTMY